MVTGQKRWLRCKYVIFFIIKIIETRNFTNFSRLNEHEIFAFFYNLNFVIKLSVANWPYAFLLQRYITDRYIVNFLNENLFHR